VLLPILLVLLAVIFVGKGIATLQEGRHIARTPVSFPGISHSRVYPNLLGLLLQAGLMLIIAQCLPSTPITAQRRPEKTAAPPW